MAGFTVAKFKEIGTTQKSIKQFQKYINKQNKKAVPKKNKKKKTVSKSKKRFPQELSHKEQKRLLGVGRKYAADLREKATHWELVMKDMLMELSYDFTFQYPIVAIDKLFILDFYLPQYKLCIEIDGFSTHGSKEQRKADSERSKKLKKKGIHVLRLWNSQVEKFSLLQIDQIIKTKISLINLENTK